MIGPAASGSAITQTQLLIPAQIPDRLIHTNSPKEGYRHTPIWRLPFACVRPQEWTVDVRKECRDGNGSNGRFGCECVDHEERAAASNRLLVRGIRHASS